MYAIRRLGNALPACQIARDESAETMAVAAHVGIAPMEAISATRQASANACPIA